MNSLHILLAIGFIALVYYGRDQQLRARRYQRESERVRRAYARLDNDYQSLWSAHEVALEDCQAMTDALMANVAQRHPATRHLTVVREG